MRPHTNHGASGKQGAFTFVLHSHLPYARLAGRWPHGEEWIHQAATDTYLPLLAALHDLAAEGVRYRLTIGVTPVLTEQLADPDVLRNFDEYLAGMHTRAVSDVARFEREGDGRRAAAAAFYRDRYAWLLDQFRRRFGRDIIDALRWLQEKGYVEIASSAATHGYLPLFERDSGIYSQIATGVRSYKRHFGQAPESFWLPECAYRAAYMNDAGVHKPGLEEFLAEQDVRVFFVETHTILGGTPVGKASGDAIGVYGEIRKRADVPPAPSISPTHNTTFQPYWVSTPRVAAIGRNLATGQQVWSADHGYPGDFAYREFHKKDSESGLQYWRVTGDKVELGDKDVYDPRAAFARTEEHARHFAQLVEKQVHDYRAQNHRGGIVSAAYDTELFGHWWFEGVEWLKSVLRALSASHVVELTGAAEYVRNHPPQDVVQLPEGSWGQQGTHYVWDNTETRWVWPIITEAQHRMEAVAAHYAGATGDMEDALDQMARELLLLESSDWPFLITTGQAREYAEQRFNDHVARFNALADQIEAGLPDPAFVHDLWHRDKLFADIEFADFVAREGVATAPQGSAVRQSG